MKDQRVEVKMSVISTKVVDFDLDDIDTMMSLFQGRAVPSLDEAKVRQVLGKLKVLMEFAKSREHL